MFKNFISNKRIDLKNDESIVFKNLIQYGWAKISWFSLFHEKPEDSYLFQQMNKDFELLLSVSDKNLSDNISHSKSSFMVKRSDVDPLSPSAYLLKLAFMPEIIRIVASYLPNYFLYGADYWWNFKPKNNDRFSSQLWHRDPEAKKILKVFVLMRDVDYSNGPTEFISSSHKTSNVKVLSKFCSSSISISDLQIAALRQKIEFSHVFMTGKTGDLCFLDTSGIHRGGFCDDDRLISYLCFLSKSLSCPHSYPSWSLN